MVLHTLNALPHALVVADCLRLLAADDALLLLGDATYLALADSEDCQRLKQVPAKVYLLAEDAAARGITDKLWAEATELDMEGFVTLTEQYPRQQAWF